MVDPLKRGCRSFLSGGCAFGDEQERCGFERRITVGSQWHRAEVVRVRLQERVPKQIQALLHESIGGLRHTIARLGNRVCFHASCLRARGPCGCRRKLRCSRFSMPLSWECGAGTMQDVARQPFVVTFAWLEHDVQGERHHCFLA